MVWTQHKHKQHTKKSTGKNRGSLYIVRRRGPVLIMTGKNSGSLYIVSEATWASADDEFELAKSHGLG